MTRIHKTGKITIHHGVNGGVKGGKGRVVYFGKTARKAIWRYLAEREHGENAEALLFLGKSGYPFLGACQSSITSVP
jgi:integrase/recombinase XerD